MVAIYATNDVATYFDSFGVEHLLKKIQKFIGSQIIEANIYRMKVYDSIISGHFCYGSIDFMLNNEIQANFTNLFSPNSFKKLMK